MSFIYLHKTQNFITIAEPTCTNFDWKRHVQSREILQSSSSWQLAPYLTPETASVDSQSFLWMGRLCDQEPRWDKELHLTEAQPHR